MTNYHVALEVSRDEHYKTPYLKSLKESWPSLARDFRHFCHAAHPKAGEIWTWVSPEGQRFFHLILDEQEYQETEAVARLHNFKKALKNLKKTIQGEEVSSIQLPKIGFHFDQKEIEVAQGMLREVFMDSDIDIKFV